MNGGEMREYVVSRDERGQRLDKYLKRRLPQAPSSFIYKMLRKKNITLRGKKADGSEKIEEGDSVIFYLSDETIEKFSDPVSSSGRKTDAGEDERAFRQLQPLLGSSPVLYEDEDILIVIKPAGILSQKAAPDDLSMNEWLRGYLGQKKTNSVSAVTNAASGFRPSVCNRLDRNTGGILLCAKSLQGSRDLSAAIRDRLIRKTYRMVVHGKLTSAGIIDKDLVKDRQSNQVSAVDPAVSNAPSGQAGLAFFSENQILRTKNGTVLKVRGKKGDKHELVSRHAVTVYRPVLSGNRASLVEADLITGRSHQLRVHMASIGHPILFDPRYGSRELDRPMYRLVPVPSGNTKADGQRKNRGQLLWCTQIQFPEQIDGVGSGLNVLQKLRGRVFTSPEPEWWKTLC